MKKYQHKRKYIKALVKVTSKKEFAEDFRKGKLYMNELRFFTECEKREMGDGLEGRVSTTHIHNYMVNMVDTSQLCRPIFCMYGLYGARSIDSYISICKQMKEFGAYAVVVTNTAEFFRRMNKVGLEFGPVKYIDIQSNDLYDRIPYNPIYNKSNSFSHQREFRIIQPDVFLTKNSVEKYDTLPSIDDDHYEAVIDEGLEDITSDILDINSIIQPNGMQMRLKISWEDVRFEDYIHYEYN